MTEYKKSEELIENEMKVEKKSRREFIKKVAYKAPVLIVMGQLARPEKLKAESRLPPPPVWP